MSEKRNFNWENTYKEKPSTEMGWYYPELDPDLKFALNELNIKSGDFLDLGTGPGTQAIELYKKGFKVIGTDISKIAIERASKLTDKVTFISDDILNTKLNTEFDYVFDRGCYHVFSDEDKPKYIKSLRKILKRNGILFLKCFSDKEPYIGKGPYRSSPESIHKVFGNDFAVKSIKDTVYQGTRDKLPKAYFSVIIRV